MKLRKFLILIIDDDESDRLLIEMALRQTGVTDEIHSVDSGERAIAYMRGEGEYGDRARFPYPTLLLTDLKMPETDGFSVLASMKAHPEWRIIPVLVLSGSDDTDDVKRAYAMGASCYLKKPAAQSELRRMLKLFYDFWKECELPEIDVTGKQVTTEHEGKLGERFGPVK